ncbi:MAG: hypothetical protein U5K54_28730 [Cytophagales bacterium]|nr:hypothetical protein [Cytophagales bacterium]
MPQLVDRSLYQNAITWNSTIWESASVGAAHDWWFDLWIFWNYGCDTADALLVLAALFCYLTIPNRPLPAASAEQGIAEKIKAGIKFVFNNQIILGAITLDLFAVLFGGAVALLPIFAAEILKVGEIGLGFLRSAPAIGALSMAVYITHHPIKKELENSVMVCGWFWFMYV